MRRLVPTAVLLALLTLLSGCFKLDMDLEVNDDDTLDGVVVFALDEELAALADEESELSEEDMPDGATVEDYEEGGWVGQKVTFRDVPMDELSDSFSDETDTGGPKDWTLVHEGGEYRFSGDLDLTEMTAEEDGVDMSAFMESAELRVALTFPGDVTDANGEVDGTTVTWEPEIGETNEMTAVAEEGSGLPSLELLATIGVAVLAVLGLGALALFTRRRRA